MQSSTVIPGVYLLMLKQSSQAPTIFFFKFVSLFNIIFYCNRNWQILFYFGKLVYVIHVSNLEIIGWKKILRTAKIGRGHRPSPIWLSEEFFESNYFQNCTACSPVTGISLSSFSECNDNNTSFFWSSQQDSIDDGPDLHRMCFGRAWTLTCLQLLKSSRVEVKPSLIVFLNYVPQKAL